MPAKLHQAGAVIMGLTNTPLIDSNIYGRTNNPWDVERSADGSSSGSAAAVAAGLSPLDIGSDAYGSILNPASVCGVFGMRPTEHRVSNAGTRALGTPATFLPFSVQGPLTRSVEDLELALQVISGPDGRDMNVPPVPWRKATEVKLQGLRLAWSHTFPKMPLAKDIHDSVESLAAELGGLGVHVEQTMPELDYVKARDVGWQFVVFTWGKFFGANDEPPVKLDDFYKAVAQREKWVRIWEQFFTQWDVFLCPTTITTASLHTDTGPIVDGKAYTYEEVSISTYSFSPLTGFPSIAIPVGLDSQGLPIGLQLIGRRWEDERLLAIAKLVSEVTGGFRRPPGY
jgi:amidase